MTTLEALKYSVNYPLTDKQALPILIGRGLSGSESFTQSIAQSKEYRLSYADTLRFVLTMVNLSQSGTVSQAAAAQIRGTANAIYEEYGEPLIGDTADPVAIIHDLSDKF